MQWRTIVVAEAFLLLAGSSAFAQSLYGGQYPAPPWIANRMALPECGFAATEPYGPNGFEYCDPKNIYPPLYPPPPRRVPHRYYR